MGERDLRSTQPGPARRDWRDAGPALVIALLLVALALARPPEPPASARGVALVLEAQSLARDLDLRFGVDDLERLRALPQGHSMEVLLAETGDTTAGAFSVPVPLVVPLAPFALLGGLRAVVIGCIVWTVLAMWLAARTLRQRLDTPWRLLVVFLFGSVALVYLFEPRPEVLALAAVVAAFALAYRSETPSFQELPEIFDRPQTLADPRFAGRWLAVGLLLGLAALVHPLHLALAVPAALALPSQHRRGGRVLLAVGVAATLALAVGGALFLGGALPWVSPLVVVDSGSLPPEPGAFYGGGFVPSILSGFGPLLDLPLVAWNALFFVAGQSVGLAAYCLPLLLALALWEPAAGRSTLVVTALVVGVAAFLGWPFDFAGDASLGNAWWLPAYGALWLAPTRRTGWVAPLALAALAGLALWPSWLGTVGLRPGIASTGAPVAPLVARWLPVETTLRPVGQDFVSQGDVRVFLAGGAVSERRGRLFLGGGRWGSVVIASPRPLDRLLLAFDGQAGAELDVVGGELGNTMFQPDGGVGFEIVLPESPRRHPMWWSSHSQSLYDLKLRLPGAAPIPVAFRLGGG
ncbi:MAG: hypothetical protein R3244_01695 [Thermoanaerobaculia bacterium]|nr:hypothetical protein [Thermoanaerobaculia bacterium]